MRLPRGDNVTSCSRRSGTNESRLLELAATSLAPRAQKRKTSVDAPSRKETRGLVHPIDADSRLFSTRMGTRALTTCHTHTEMAVDLGSKRATTPRSSREWRQGSQAEVLCVNCSARHPADVVSL